MFAKGELSFYKRSYNIDRLLIINHFSFQVMSKLLLRVVTSPKCAGESLDTHGTSPTKGRRGPFDVPSKKVSFIKDFHIIQRRIHKVICPKGMKKNMLCLLRKKSVFFES